MWQKCGKKKEKAPKGFCYLDHRTVDGKYGVIVDTFVTTREGYHTYKSNPAYCQTCLLRTQCTQNQKAERLITRHIYQEAIDNANAVRLSEQGKKLYKHRAETVERSFADAKQHHRHRYARYRGLSKVQMQCFLAAWAQNIKKIALVVWDFCFVYGCNYAHLRHLQKN